MTGVFLLLLIGLADPGEAERAYRAGDYEAAFGFYEAALTDSDSAEGPILYNLGNCAYRLGHYARAVLYYRRAQLRLPHDHEVAFNLDRAQRQLDLAPAADGSAGWAALDALSPGWLLLLTIAVQSLALAGVALLRSGAGVRWCLLGVAVLAWAAPARLVYRLRFPEPPAGVVLAREIALRPEPHSLMPVLLELREGQEIRAPEMSDRWARVVHSRGTGWTERAGVGLVD